MTKNYTCSTCGALVKANAYEAHTKWHETRNTSRINTESDIRDLDLDLKTVQYSYNNLYQRMLELADHVIRYDTVLEPQPEEACEAALYWQHKYHYCTLLAHHDGLHVDSH